MNFPWYQMLEGPSSIEQGDLIPNCPIIIPPAVIEVKESPTVKVYKIDSIVMTQSCDLAHNKIELVLVCPYSTLKYWLDNSGKHPNEFKKIIKDLVNGYLPGYHLLNCDTDMMLSDYIVVDFKNVYGIQYTALKQVCVNMKSRVRLLPPYREHLSQAFARYFMRVGLPQNIEVQGYY